MSESNLQDIEATELALQKEILDCLNLDSPRSFLLFAGAGSGKTRTLVNVLREFRHIKVPQLVRAGQQVAIITYTNAACEEIKHRLEYDPAFSVSTIHSFAWGLIEPFTKDIKEWLQGKLANDIEDLKDKLRRSRNLQNLTALRNQKSLESKQKRLARLDEVTRFSYSPAGGNIKKDSINHTEVISMTADFLSNQPLMQNILIQRYPILLIDESQDTNKELLEAFIATQQNNQTCFCLGLFGDLMQRIYGGGKHDLATTLPDDWITPSKIVNHRCPKRVITLINQIRDEASHQQQPRTDSQEGHIRMFVVNASANDKLAIETEIRKQMAEITADDGWLEGGQVKTLALEHHLAAVRGGFNKFFEPLLADDKLRDASLNGTSSEMNFLIQQLLALIVEINNSDDFAIANIIKKYSPLIDNNQLTKSDDPIELIKIADDAVNELSNFINGNKTITIFEVVKQIHQLQLLVIPESFKPLLIEAELLDEQDNANENNDQAWQLALQAPFEQLSHYAAYLSENSSFDTHQGVKGLQFERVMVVLDDEQARGFLFSYEKLLGAKELTARDLENENEGKDAAHLRTRRLFYVTCSRAEKSLAVVTYTKDPAAVKNYVTQVGWFEQDEVFII